MIIYFEEGDAGVLETSQELGLDRVRGGGIAHKG